MCETALAHLDVKIAYVRNGQAIRASEAQLDAIRISSGRDLGVVFDGPGTFVEHEVDARVDTAPYSPREHGDIAHPFVRTSTNKVVALAIEFLFTDPLRSSLDTHRLKRQVAFRPPEENDKGLIGTTRRKPAHAADVSDVGSKLSVVLLEQDRSRPAV
jgi:hypothetical protein